MSPLTVLILTRDEELNLPTCVASLEPLRPVVWIVDSGSTDRTLAIAREAGCNVVERGWTNHADQLNWALDTLPIKTPWVMRLDADERLTPELASELAERLPALPADVTGLLVKRRVYFWGRWIRHGGYYPTWLLRVWRHGEAHCEVRWMDEHMLLARGRSLRLAYDLIDENRKGLGFWVEKHNRYADREVRDMRERSEDGPRPEQQAGRRRWAKAVVYARLPLFLRPLLYFLYRYFMRLGFLDGRPGLVFHLMQGFWYRLLIDAKLHELKYGAPAASSAADLRRIATSTARTRSPG
jgi:glycosyltransferase involved in cell wall biosynthesis